MTQNNLSLREFDDKDYTFNINSKNGLYRVQSLCRYPELDDVQRLKKHILLNSQIVRQVCALKEMRIGKNG